MARLRTYTSAFTQVVGLLLLVRNNNKLAVQAFANVPVLPTARACKAQFRTNGPLFASLRDKDKAKAPSGVYSRPSAAIEKGSGKRSQILTLALHWLITYVILCVKGFYVPGLEGSRVRGIFGILVLALNYLNQASSSSTANSSYQSTSESITVLFGFLLIIQGIVEYAKEAGFVVNETSSNSSTLTKAKSASNTSDLNLTYSSSLNDTQKEGLRWLGASIISLTPASAVLLVDNQQVLFRLGSASEVPTASLDAAVETSQNSTGGRVAVPATHPAAMLMPEDLRKCVILQRLGKQCLVLGSSQVLQAFTKNDLLWLGSLANYYASL